MKVFIIVIVTAALVLAGVWTVGQIGGKSSDEKADATAVRVQPAGRGDVIETVSAPGIVQPKNKVSISARVAARIVQLPFEEGQSVTKGDASATPPAPASVLVKLDSTDMEALLKSAQARSSAQAAQIDVARGRIAAQEAQLRSTKVSLADGQRDLSRQKELLASKDVSQAVVDQAQARVDGLLAQVTAAEENLRADQTNLVVMKHNLDAADAEITRAKDALSYTTIVSPIDGIVTRLNAKPGELVMTGTMNNPGTVILEVADLSQMLLQAKVDETSVGALRVGQHAEVRMQAYRDDVFEGTVSTIALASTEERDGSKYYKAEILLKTDGRRIYSGLTGDVLIETRRHTDVVRVPTQAVLGRKVDDLPDKLRELAEVDRTKTMATVVYRFIDGKAVVTPVRIGASDVMHTIIQSGLAENDQVITGPYKVLESLRHDQKVKIEEAGKATTSPAK